jgi:hypothetical protein
LKPTLPLSIHTLLLLQFAKSFAGKLKQEIETSIALPVTPDDTLNIFVTSNIGRTFRLF